MAWYREWFGEEYLELYAHRDAGEAEAHVAFVEQVLSPAGPGAVLDLACGAGRHTAALTRRGHRAIGIDLSLTLLVRAAEVTAAPELVGAGELLGTPGLTRELAPTRPAVAPGRAELARVRGDMRSLPFAAGSFAWVLNFFTSFGYFESERENFRVLEEIVRVLAPRGQVLIDFLNLDRVLAELQESERAEIDGRQVEIERRYDAPSRRLTKRIRLLVPGRPARTFLESVRAYREEEVVNGLRWAGLEVTGRYGNFQGEPFRRDSERLILVGRRAA